MKTTLLSFAVLLCLAARPAPAAGGLAAPGDVLREPRLAAKFDRDYGARYSADSGAIVKELSSSQDPDASALLALIMLSGADSLTAGDAAYALGRRLKDPVKDLPALDFLELGLKSGSPHVRFAAIMAVTGFISSPSFGAYTPEYAAQHLIPRASAMLAAAENDPDRDVQSALGSLGKSVQDWQNFQSPQAMAREAKYKKTEHRKNVTMFLISLCMPLTVLAAGVIAIVSKGGVAWLLIRPSGPLEGALRGALQVFRRAPLLTLAPVAAGTLVMCLISWVVYSAFAIKGLRPGMSNGEVQAKAIMLMLSPRIAAAYLAAGFGVFFFNSMIADSLVHEIRGQAFGFFEALSSALRRIGGILVLSLMAFGAVYILRLLAEKFKVRFGGWWDRALELAVTMTESGVMLAANYMLAVMMAEGTGLREAFRRTEDLVRGGRTAALRSFIGMSAIRYESAAAACLLPFLFFVTLMPSMGALGGDAHNWLSAKLGFPGMDDYLLFFRLGIGASLLCGAITLAVVQSLEGILAVGVYFNDKGVFLPDAAVPVPAKTAGPYGHTGGSLL